MNVAELFISLGIKGSDKTIGALDKTRAGLKETASTSLEMKAAIVGAMYALERLFAASGKAGTDLSNFNALTGGSAQTLQKYQYAARQVGISNEATAGTFKSLQSAMAKTLQGEGAPKGMAQLVRRTGEITREDIKRFGENPALLIQKLQQYAQLEKNVLLRNEVLKSFVPEEMIPALVKNAFNPSALRKAPTYSDKESESLNKSNIAWSNLGTKIDMSVGHFNAKYGKEIVKDITKIVDKITELANAFMALDKNAKIFEKIDLIISGWTKIFDGLIAAVKVYNELTSDKPEEQVKGDKAVSAAVDDVTGVGKEVGKDLEGFFSGLPGVIKQVWKENGPQYQGHSTPTTHPTGKSVAPPKVPNTTPGPSNTKTTTINQTLNFGDNGTDPQKVAEAHKKGIKDAYRTQDGMGPN